MIDFELPDVGEGIAEAELLEWMVDVGDRVAEGDAVAIVNTDKVTVDLPSPVDGTVVELPWSVGDVIQVGQVLISFEDLPGNDGPNRVQSPDNANPMPAKARTNGDTAQAKEIGIGSAAISPILGRVIAAPSTRALAAESGIDLGTVRGNGPGGRILRADVLAFSSLESASQSSPSPVTQPSGQGRTRSLSGLRLLSARNIAKSRASTVTCTTTFEVRGEPLRDLLDALKSTGLHITVPVVVAKCAAAALKQHPHLNGWIIDDGSGMQLQNDVDVAFAVATDAGLAVPIVRNVDSRPLRAIALDLADVSDRARGNRLHPDQQVNGTFTVSSTGSLEKARILSTTPVLNYPQPTTLWVGRINPTVRVSPDHSVQAGLSMVCSFSFDHRFVDGSEATAFINDLADALERPVGAIL